MLRLHVILALVVCLTSFLKAVENRAFVFQEPHMGCLFTMKLVSSDEASAKLAAQAAFAKVRSLDSIMSDYAADSELNKLCGQAGQPVRVSPPLLAVLERSAEFSRWSSGAFDVTLGPCTQLWRSSKKSRTLPDPAALEAARSLVGWENVRLDPAASQVILAKAGMKLDLGGIAKGFALDSVTQLLREEFHLSDFLLDAAGQLAAIGTPPGKSGWTLAIEKTPEEADTSTTEVVRLRDLHLATSGDLHQHVDIAGQRYSHILDPKTGLGLTTPTQASVIAGNGTLADAAATVLCMLDPAAGLELLKKYPGTEARVVRVGPDGRAVVATTPGWGKLAVKR